MLDPGGVTRDVEVGTAGAVGQRQLMDGSMPVGPGAKDCGDVRIGLKQCNLATQSPQSIGITAKIGPDIKRQFAGADHQRQQRDFRLQHTPGA